MLLKIDNIHVHYGHVAALKGISLEVGEADFVTLIGSNGSGKSTTLRAISGLESQLQKKLKKEKHEKK